MTYAATDPASPPLSVTYLTPGSLSMPDHHPVADLFPMLPEDELRDLAHDIAQRGLLQPIVRDKEGRILDGRNRYAACEMAGVEPKFETYDGDDPDGYALAVNIARRHLSKGQIAMITARAGQVQQSWTAEGSARVLRSLGTKISGERVRQAAVVLECASELADKVITGHPDWPLNKAYDEAKRRRDQKAATEEREAARQRDYDQLRHAAPDLADLVDEERLELDEALRLRRERAEREREDAKKANTLMAEAVAYLDAVKVGTWRTRTVQQLAMEITAAPSNEAAKVNPINLREIAKGLEALADEMENT